MVIRRTLQGPYIFRAEKTPATGSTGKRQLIMLGKFPGSLCAEYKEMLRLILGKYEGTYKENAMDFLGQCRAAYKGNARGF